MVANFIICCDLQRGNKRQYADFYAALEVFADRCQAMDAVWFICTRWPQRSVHDYLRRYIDAEDGLMVERIPANAGWSGWVGEDVRSWLQQHLGSPDTGG